MPANTDLAGGTLRKIKPDVNYLGKLDRELYRGVAENLPTDDVVLTNERIAHIKDHHPGDFEKYGEHMPEIIKSPDFIIKSEDYATVLLLKRFKLSDETSLRLVMRLQTSKDTPGYMNSVVSFQKIHAKEYRRLANKAAKEGKLLYKRQDS